MSEPGVRMVSADVGGTHARFAVASIKGEPVELGEPVTLRAADHASFESGWFEPARDLAGNPVAAAYCRNRSLI